MYNSFIVTKEAHKMQATVKRETLLQRLRRHYQRQGVRMSRHTPGSFLLVKNEVIVGKIEDAETAARNLGVMKDYEVIE
ncbi:hypothetical protein [Pantoea agglomerans]|uniref:hypothetical protein n=1 Tax=Enterobacter agglomerans TaxID=549 RepID=UPI00278B610B|nr:hypothetical protein [Pantoea agglomerans]MDQ0435624.1 hypothetical protein [Pantoea agglomerans]